MFIIIDLTFIMLILTSKLKDYQQQLSKTMPNACSAVGNTAWFRFLNAAWFLKIVSEADQVITF